MTDPHNQGILPRWLFRLPLIALTLAALTYGADSAVFSMRGGPLDRVTVNSYLAVPLKGNKTEYDFEGTQPVSCAKALFPQAGHSPCWYLRRHTTISDKL